MNLNSARGKGPRRSLLGNKVIGHSDREKTLRKDVLVNNEEEWNIPGNLFMEAGEYLWTWINDICGELTSTRRVLSACPLTHSFIHSLPKQASTRSNILDVCQQEWTYRITCTFTGKMLRSWTEHAVDNCSFRKGIEHQVAMQPFQSLQTNNSLL